MGVYAGDVSFEQMAETGENIQKTKTETVETEKE